ncbi:MAG TPA: nickel-dependent hydrogenase large subunit [Campylobacterales bacterium]|nr:nickel-dependent hydrogenase large subunit [Campylobacterales bacterium]
MSKTINIPLGSQHIALLEPVRFSFECENEKIIGVEADVGYVHRGIELACTTKFKFKQVGYVVARVCGLCAIVHSTCYTLAVEELLNIEVPKKASYLRIIANELDRIHSHLLCLAHTAENAGFEALFMRTMKDRELVMEVQETMTGNRIQFDYISIGGVNKDITSEMESYIREKLGVLKQKVGEIKELFLNNWSLSLKYKGVGVITKESALNRSVLGPLTRASGVDFDVRKESDYLPYGELGFKSVVMESGDIHARNMVRLEELLESIRLIETAFDAMPEGGIASKVRGTPDGESYMRVEAPRGECFYYLKASKGQFLDRVRIKTPTFGSVPGMIEALKGQNYADAPAIIASFDPCLSCTAR